MDWSNEQTEFLIEEWGKGTYASVIGQKLRVSKSSVLGKAHRLGLPSRPNGQRNKLLFGPPPPPKLRVRNKERTLSKLSSVVDVEAVQMLPHRHQEQSNKPTPPPPSAVVIPLFTSSKQPTEGCSYIARKSKPFFHCDAPVYGRRNTDGTMHWYSYCYTHYCLCYQVNRKEFA